MSHVTITHRRSIADGDSLLGLVDALVRQSIRGWAEVSYAHAHHADVVVCVPVRAPHLIEIRAVAALVVPETFEAEQWELWQLLRALRPDEGQLDRAVPFVYKTYLNAKARGAAA